jgi:hypothetical protein
MRAFSWFQVFCVFVLSVAVPVATQAQAWTPPRGEGDYSVVFQDLYTRDHLLQDGQRLDAGHINLVGVVQSIDLGLTDKFAVTLAIPFGAGRYSGKFPHQLPIDDGTYHPSLQDMGIGLRYNWRARPLMLTPFVLGTFPMNHYEHFAHSAIGTDSWEFRMGMNVGHHFETMIPRAYYQVQYSYAIVQSFMNYRPNKSRFNGEFGYFLTRRLSLRTLALSQLSHGGLDFNDFGPRVPTNRLWRQHDRISRTDGFTVGGGAAYAIRRNLDVFGSLLHTVWGRNSHALYTGLSVGVSWNFRMPWAGPQMGYDQSTGSIAWQAQMNQPPQMQCAH